MTTKVLRCANCGATLALNYSSRVAYEGATAAQARELSRSAGWSSSQRLTAVKHIPGAYRVVVNEYCERCTRDLVGQNTKGQP